MNIIKFNSFVTAGAPATRMTLDQVQNLVDIAKANAQATPSVRLSIVGQDYRQKTAQPLNIGLNNFRTK